MSDYYTFMTSIALDNAPLKNFVINWNTTSEGQIPFLCFDDESNGMFFNCASILRKNTFSGYELDLENNSKNAILRHIYQFEYGMSIIISYLIDYSGMQKGSTESYVPTISSVVMDIEIPGSIEVYNSSDGSATALSNSTITDFYGHVWWTGDGDTSENKIAMILSLDDGGGGGLPVS